MIPVYEQRYRDIRSAALFFATETRNAEKIAAKIGVSARTVHRYAKTETWRETLNALEYTGKHGFSNGNRLSQYLYARNLYYSLPLVLENKRFSIMLRDPEITVCRDTLKRWRCGLYLQTI